MSYIVKLDINAKQDSDAIQSEIKDDIIAWVYPFAILKWEKINLKKKKQILVKLNERAIVYNKESFVVELSNGLYKIDRKNGLEDHKIVFLERNLINLKWGIPQLQGVLTKDNIKIGTSGTVSLTITNPQVFVLNVLKNENILSSKRIRPLINNIVKDAMREIFPEYDIKEIQKISKEELIMLFEPLIVEELQKRGLSSQDLTLSGLGIPPEYRQF